MVPLVRRSSNMFRSQGASVLPKTGGYGAPDMGEGYCLCVPPTWSSRAPPWASTESPQWITPVHPPTSSSCGSEEPAWILSCLSCLERGQASGIWVNLLRKEHHEMHKQPGVLPQVGHLCRLILHSVLGPQGLCSVLCDTPHRVRQCDPS